MRFKYTKSQRLLKSAEFKHVFANPNKILSPHVLLFYCGNELGYPRLGVSVAKKNVNSAVLRNRFKRSVREKFRLQQHKLSGIDIVILAGKNAAQISPKELGQCLEMQLQKLIMRQKK